MTREAFARLAFEAHHDAAHPAGGGWDAWTAMHPEDGERAKWLAVGALIEACVDGAVAGATASDATVPGADGILDAYRHQNALLLAEREQLRGQLGQLPAGQEPPGSAVSVEEHRWYAVVRDGVDGEVVKVIGYRGDSGISCYDSLAAWEAADQ